jgi:ribosome-binding protein aMBF1 (putative translation factor)
MNRKTMEQKKAELMQDIEFKKAYESKEMVFAVALEAIKARKSAKMTQVEVAEQMKTTQSAVARLESAKSAPTLATLERYARAIGKRLCISFQPAC